MFSNHQQNIITAIVRSCNAKHNVNKNILCTPKTEVCAIVKGTELGRSKFLTGFLGIAYDQVTADGGKLMEEPTNVNN